MPSQVWARPSECPGRLGTGDSPLSSRRAGTQTAPWGHSRANRASDHAAWSGSPAGPNPTWGCKGSVSLKTCTFSLPLKCTFRNSQPQTQLNGSQNTSTHKFQAKGRVFGGPFSLGTVWWAQMAAVLGDAGWWKELALPCRGGAAIPLLPLRVVESCGIHSLPS